MINEKTGQRELAYVVRIDEIQRIPNYDRVEYARVNGWWVVVRKDQFKVGDPAVYFEVDSQVPAKEPFLFLEPRHFKIKTQKMCKVISQGLLMPFEDFGWTMDNHKVGDFVTKELNVTYTEAEDNKRKAKPADKYSKMVSRHPKIFKKRWAKFLMKRNWGKKLLFLFFGKKKDKSTAFPTHFPFVHKTDQERVENMPFRRDIKYKAWVNIMYGCDKFCTYCIVPYTRGRQRSRMPEDILNEVKKLKEDNYQEVTLLGQNVNAYGKDLDINYSMANLLEDVAKIGINRIRFVTSHPWDFNDEMIDVIAKYPNIMPYIHLPLQSGSDRILKLMGRKYTKASYLELFDKLKAKVKNVSITTDIIVGFPNETEEDFKETLDVVDYCKYDSAFTFIFSPRVGTPAAKMVDNVTLEEKEARLQRLNEIVNKYSKENNLKYLDKIVPVLLENVSEKNDEYLAGYTDTMKLVNVKAPKEYLGKIVNVKITDVKTWSLDGELVEVNLTNSEKNI